MNISSIKCGIPIPPRYQPNNHNLKRCGRYAKYPLKIMEVGDQLIAEGNTRELRNLRIALANWQRRHKGVKFKTRCIINEPGKLRVWRVE